jgi:ribosomal protein S25
VPRQAVARTSRPADAGRPGAEAPGDSADSPRQQTQRIQAVDRAVALLKSVAASATPPTVLELARECGINRSTAWRLLRTLEHHGLVDRDPITQRYTVGYGAISVAATVTDDALVRRVRPLLSKLAAVTGESATLAVAKRFTLVYVDQVDPPNVMVPNWLDRPLPLHATSGVPGLAGPRRAGRDPAGGAAALHRAHHHRPRSAGARVRRGPPGRLRVVQPGVRGVLLRRLGRRAEQPAVPDRRDQRLGPGAP